MRLAVRQHGTVPTDAPPMPTDLTPDEARVLGLVPPEETHIEAIIHASQLPRRWPVYYSH
jgi:hypothetical protein